jgi:hypothetical protein
LPERPAPGAVERPGHHLRECSGAPIKQLSRQPEDPLREGTIKGQTIWARRIVYNELVRLGFGKATILLSKALTLQLVGRQHVLTFAAVAP